MVILPPRTRPYAKEIVRRHKPAKRSDYTEYRQCLRWEFGFTCAICLLHESDLAEYGVERTGLSSVEHIDTQVDSPSKRTAYENCIYVCRECNLSRHTRPLRRADGARLLNPASDVWNHHFDVMGDHLVARPSDNDAQYTHSAYDIDADKKVYIRGMRQKKMEENLNLVRTGPEKYRFLRELAENLQESGRVSESEEVRNAAQLLYQSIWRAWESLQRYNILPQDRKECRCDSDVMKIPEVLLRQALSIKAPLLSI